MTATKVNVSKYHARGRTVWKAIWYGTSEGRRVRFRETLGPAEGPDKLTKRTAERLQRQRHNLYKKLERYNLK